MTTLKNSSFKTPRTFNFSLTMTGLAAWLVLAVVLLSSFFALGVVVGRSYRPKPVVMAPGPEPVKVIAAPAPAEANLTVAQETTVLKPEELHYMERLKQRPEAVPAPEPAKAAVKDKEPARKPEPDKKAKPEPVQEKQVLPPDPDQTVYDYIYQVASFVRTDQAEEMKKRVARLGFSCAVQSATDDRGVARFRVVVFFKGRPEDTRAMKEKLSAVGVSKPLLVSKKPS